MLKCLRTQIDARGMVCTRAAKEERPVHAITCLLCLDCGLGARSWILRLSQGDTRPSHDCVRAPYSGISVVGQT
jgi:hypothetical protein